LHAAAPRALGRYGRRGRTFKGSIVLAAVSAVRPTVDPTAPAGAVELEADSSRGAASIAAAAAASAVAAAAAKAAGIATGTTPPAGDDSALAAMERRRLSRPAAQPGGFGSYAVTFVIAADAADAAPFLAALRAAVPEAATSELQLQARVSKWAGAGLAPEDYALGRTVGSGTFGKVKLAVGPDGREVAIKILSRSRLIGTNQVGRLTQEISILRCLRHPHVIALEAVHHLPAAIWMVLEYVPGGDLLTLLNEKAKNRCARGMGARRLRARCACARVCVVCACVCTCARVRARARLRSCARVMRTRGCAHGEAALTRTSWPHTLTRTAQHRTPRSAPRTLDRPARARPRSGGA
jgi:hypothetical protein